MLRIFRKWLSNAQKWLENRLGGVIVHLIVSASVTNTGKPDKITAFLSPVTGAGQVDQM